MLIARTQLCPQPTSGRRLVPPMDPGAAARSGRWALGQVPVGHTSACSTAGRFHFPSLEALVVGAHAIQLDGAVRQAPEVQAPR